MSINYDHAFRMRYKAASEMEQNKMLDQFYSNHYGKSYAWAKAINQKASKDDADDVFQNSMLFFDKHLLWMPGNNNENLGALFHIIFKRQFLKLLEKYNKMPAVGLDKADIMPNDNEKAKILQEVFATILSEEPNSLDGYCKTYYRALLGNLLSPQNKNSGRKLLGEMLHFIKNNTQSFLAFAIPGQKVKIPMNSLEDKNTKCKEKLREILKTKSILIFEKQTYEK